MTIHLNLDGMTEEGADRAIAEFLPRVMQHATEKDQVAELFLEIEDSAEQLGLDDFTKNTLFHICCLIHGMIVTGHTGAQTLEVISLIHQQFKSRFGANT